MSLVAIRTDFIAGIMAASNAFLSNLFNVAGKVVVVTGGSRGIGLMIAQGFVCAGATVYITSRKQAVCDKAAASLNAQGPGSCVGFAADVSTQSGRDALVEFVGSKESKIHCLVNNAGCNWVRRPALHLALAPQPDSPLPQGEELETFPEAAWDKVLALNLKAVFYVTRGFLPLLEASASHECPASVINIGSIDGIQTPALNTFSYGSSKAAVHHLSKTLAHHLAPRHITVNAVAPGPFQSKMMAATLEAVGDMIVEQNPMKRIGKPSDMAGVAIWLASPAGSYVNGALIAVDGGAVVAPAGAKL